MLVSVICSTYNSAAWLEKVLWGYACQTYRDLEVVVADDGSTDRTVEVIHAARRQSGLPIEHVWHEHRGFRKCAILNAAIGRARGDYLVFTDGDCVPRADFLAEHVRLARPGCFASGGCLRLTRSASEMLTREDIESERAFSPLWLAARRTLFLHFLPRLVPGPRLAGLFDRITPTRPTWNGHNSAGWKCDILAANGFDERMVYGGLDRELGERLENAGIRPIQVRHRAVCLHLDHPRGYVSAEGIAANRQIRQQTREHGLTWTPHGIVKGPRIVSADGTAGHSEAPSRPYSAPSAGISKAA